jgi:hypothetical protein
LDFDMRELASMSRVLKLLCLINISWASNCSLGKEKGKYLFRYS